MISIDGLAAYYIDDPKSDVPTLRQLAAEGARASSMRASTPTVTWPNHTTLVTRRQSCPVMASWAIIIGIVKRAKKWCSFPTVYDKDQIVKVPTIYDVAKAAGLKTAAVRRRPRATRKRWIGPRRMSAQRIWLNTTPPPPSPKNAKRRASIFLDKDGPDLKKRKANPRTTFTPRRSMKSCTPITPGAVARGLRRSHQTFAWSEIT